MSKQTQIEAIVDFVARHPESLVSRRICRETLGSAVERINSRFTAELTSLLSQKDFARIDSYYTLIK